MSIAYGESYPILDANVKRVISRFNDIDVKDKGAIKSLWLLQKLIHQVKISLNILKE